MNKEESLKEFEESEKNNALLSSTLKEGVKIIDTTDSVTLFKKDDCYFVFSLTSDTPIKGDSQNIKALYLDYVRQIVNEVEEPKLNYEILRM